MQVRLANDVMAAAKKKGVPVIMILINAGQVRDAPRHTLAVSSQQPRDAISRGIAAESFFLSLSLEPHNDSDTQQTFDHYQNTRLQQTRSNTSPMRSSRRSTLPLAHPHSPGSSLDSRTNGAASRTLFSLSPFLDSFVDSVCSRLCTKRNRVQQQRLFINKLKRFHQ